MHVEAEIVSQLPVFDARIYEVQIQVHCEFVGETTDALRRNKRNKSTRYLGALQIHTLETTLGYRRGDPSTW